RARGRSHQKAFGETVIRQIGSSLASFKTLDFSPGLNVLLADRHSDSGEKNTRNRAGKTSAVEIIHFLLGADCDKDSLFRTDPLRSQVFVMEFGLGARTVVVERSGDRFGTNILADPASPTGGKSTLSNGDWRRSLGHVIFGLPLEESTDDLAPSFRAVFP